MTKDKPKKPKTVPWTDLATAGKGRSSQIPGVARTAQEVHEVPVTGKTILIHLAILAAVTILAYMPSFWGEFVFTDAYLINSFQDKVADPTFWTNLIASSVVSPLSQGWLKTGFATDISTFHYGAFWYHAVNVALQIMGVSYFYVLVFRLARHFRNQDLSDRLPYYQSFFTALLFACHPLLVESVAYISGRSGVLVGCNCFLALGLFLFGYWSLETRNAIIANVGAIAATLMAVASSPDGLAIPFAIVALGLLLKPKDKNWLDWFDENGAETIIWGLFAIALPLTAKLPFKLEFSNTFGMPPLPATEYLASQFKGFATYYLRTALVPFGLSVDPPYFVANGWVDPGTICGIVVFIGLLYAIYANRTKFSISFPLALVIAGFIPSILVIRKEIYSDSHFYISVAGVCMLIGWLLVRRIETPSIKAYLPSALICTLLFGLTVWRGFDWQTSSNLWQSTARVDGTDVRAQAMLAAVSLEKGDTAKAKETAQKILEKHPDNQLANLVLADCYLAESQYGKAKSQFTTARKLVQDQNLGDYEQLLTLDGLAETLVDNKDYLEAQRVLALLVVQEPGSIKTNLLLGKALIGAGQPLLALRYLNIGFKLDPLNASYLQPITEACLATGVPSLAGSAYGAARRGMKIIPTPDFGLLYARSALSISHFGEALQVLDSMLGDKNQNKVEPPIKAQALYLKSIALKELGNMPDSKACLDLAHVIDPDIEKKLKVNIFSKTELENSRRTFQKNMIPK
jgi:tetratricopeptide (TPR) repeat protein